MAANMNVTYEDMKASAGKLVAGQSQIEDLLKTLKNEIDNLVANGFVTDSASGQFQASYEEFNKGIGEAIQGLDGMAKYLTGAAGALSEVDQKLAQALNS